MPEVRPTPRPHTKYALPQQQRRPAWFWIAVGGACLSVVVPILVILALITLPQLLSVRKPANQTSAVQTLRTMASAEVSYNETYPDQGFACNLNVLGGDPNSGPPSSENAQLIDPSLASTGHHSGYIFSVTSCTPRTVNHRAINTAYTIAAIPESVGRTGDVGYCINQNNVITVDPTGRWNCTQPLK